MPTALDKGLDYSAQRISGAKIKAAGYNFVIRYLWFPGQRVSYIDANEYRDLTANGVDVELVYEQTTSDPAGGYEAGRRLMLQAVSSALSIGAAPGTIIYMCSDAWLATHGIPAATAMNFLRGARSAVGPYKLGAYGFTDFVYAAQNAGLADAYWLCGAESGVRDGITHYQWNNGRVYVDGVECDLNKRYIARNTTTTTPEEEDVKPDEREMLEALQFGTKDVRPMGRVGQVIADTGSAVQEIKGQITALINVVAATTANKDITPDAVRQMIDDAVAKATPALASQVAAKVGDDLRPELIELLGEDNAAQADEILARMATRLRAEGA